MRKILLTTLFMLATLAWAAAQQAGSPMGQSGVHPTPPGSQAPGTTQQPGMPGSTDPGNPGTQPGSEGQAASAPITEGCLGGSAPNFTITDKAGTTYKLDIPPGADTTQLSQHVGESVQVQGVINSGATPAIEARRIGKGTGTCAGSGSTAAPPAPKQ
jgi:hypothetical protein